MLIVERRDNEVRAIIEDDGLGFVFASDSAGPGHGLGLKSIVERAAAIGG